MKKVITLALLAMLVLVAFGGCSKGPGPVATDVSTETDIDADLLGLDELDTDLDLSELDNLDAEFADLENLFS